ncbi:glycosyltransferase family 4 protein [Salinarimonas sp. NSM]|uniref:glycosyltransferase family 4 protein n=1 Tax=Salinarimonas sp. NSM TaxID=3458003 RepID=UPI004036C184
MHVLYYHQHFSTPDGSTGVRSYEFARRLIAEGHAVTMVCGSYKAGRTGLDGAFRNGRRTGRVDGIEVIELELPYSNHDGLARRAFRFLEFALRSSAIALRRDYDVVFATSTPLTAGIPGILARLLRRKPFVFEVRDLWPELPRAMGVIRNPVLLAAMSALEWASYRAASHCIGLSPGMIEGITRRGVPPERVTLIPNGCDLDLFAPGDRVPSGEPLVAAYTGTLGLANGLDAVLDAAGELIRRGREDIRIVLVGDGGRKPALVARAEAEGLENCTFLDPMPKRELAAFMQRVDVGLMVLQNIPAFYYGTSPNKFFDYIAAGIPVLNNYPGWVAGMVEETGCGVAVPPGDAGAFAQALIDLADDRARLPAMAAAGRRLAQERFDRRTLAGCFVDVLEEVAGR